MHIHITEGYEWPTTILVNLRLSGNAALGHVTSSTDFMLPYTFTIELMAAARRSARIDSRPSAIRSTSPACRRPTPFPDVRLEPAPTAVAGRHPYPHPHA